MSNRRGFLRLLATAPVAAPIAARQAAGAAMYGNGPMPPTLGAGMGYYNGLGGTDSSIDPYERAQGKLVEWARSGKLPDWKIKQLRQSARMRARWLDADLLTMRSISDASRYRIQQDREFNREVLEGIEQYEFNSIWRDWIRKLSGQ